MANDLAVIANGIIVEPGKYEPSDIRGFLGFEYDYEDEFEDEYYDADWVEIIDDPSRMISEVESEIFSPPAEVDGYAIFPVHICDADREGFATKMTEEQEEEAEGTLCINTCVINDYGSIITGSDMSDLFQEVMGYDEGYAVVRVTTSNAVTARFTATLNVNYNRIDSISEYILHHYCVDSRMLFEAARDQKNRLVLTGPMCVIKRVTELVGAKILTSRLICVYNVPMNNCIMVRYEDDKLDLREPCLDIQCVHTIDGPIPGLERTYFDVSSSYNVHHRLAIALTVCTKFFNVYQCGEEIFLPIYDEGKREQYIFPLYKTLAMCYFGFAKRDSLWKAMQAMTIIQGIEIPAAAYVCPVEFLKGIAYDNILSYMQNLFKVKRPVSNNKELFNILKKCKKLTDLVQILLSMEQASKGYPVSTIGLFASTMPENSMLMQVAGCNDAMLNEQLVQELVQVLYEVNPKAIAAILTAHRSDLNKAQKQVAINAIKKYLGTGKDKALIKAQDGIEKKL